MTELTVLFAPLVAKGQEVGQAYVYPGHPSWIYFSLMMTLTRPPARSAVSWSAGMAQRCRSAHSRSIRATGVGSARHRLIGDRCPGGGQRFRRTGAQARSVNEAFSRCCRKAKRFFAAAGSGDGAPMVSGRSRRSRAGATVARLRQ